MLEIRKTEVYAKWLDSLRDVHARAHILGRVDIYLSAGDCEEFCVLTRRGEEE